MGHTSSRSPKDHRRDAVDSSDDRQPTRVLIVDDEPEVRQVLAGALRQRRMGTREAASLAEAREEVRRGEVDLVLVDARLPDGDGLDLAEELNRRAPAVPAVVITGDSSFGRAVQAMRAGACDLVAKPLDLKELNRCVDRALQRRNEQRRLAHRVDRLRKLCRKLNRDRDRTHQQSDVLCSDLVDAYQQLAGQVRHVQLATNFRAVAEQELDLEQLLRRVLEFILEHFGSTNAVIFLPAVDGGHATGGYVNYTFERETVRVLLDHLAGAAAPRIAEAESAVHLTNDEAINEWLEEESGWLAGHEVIALPARHEGEILATLLLFREASEPFEEDAAEALEALSGPLAAQLVKLINVHHRLIGEEPPTAFDPGAEDFEADDEDFDDADGDGDAIH